MSGLGAALPDVLTELPSMDGRLLGRRYVLDAANVDRAPIARPRIPQRVPTGHRAAWVPADRLAAG
ncbi:hypothetical protein [Sorangium sp. So ce1335]|uniref:hypothetical protein n=1 Tax=Sorangium sp. So ce1335 TaxID=3133335 RepID=UPI003F6416FC